ncbi:hypothetical protein KMC49_gp48 [Ralstonia phage Firinga]|uniref:Uncharacterized protein n=2 Tax=Firingavirus firinga TaxID=2846043 RepID=A0A7G5B9Z3_9CAUD|nr:hypothetical protein KMC49_gp48 [Ralstonia phage Firinga]QMV33116.1 hypothetical protein 18C_00048 [Ralstonia phage Firinga]QMV33341.1 hypothetical protein 12C_00031 [Ralstonia phage Hennie]
MSRTHLVGNFLRQFGVVVQSTGRVGFDDVLSANRTGPCKVFPSPMGISCRRAATSFANHVCHVLDVSAWIQMARIYAKAYVA